jgi:hypothetical protein
VKKKIHVHVSSGVGEKNLVPGLMGMFSLLIPNNSLSSFDIT